ncbi:YihY/virulence factor BrkB family protein [Georgenia sp. 311]|uniref:YihY/virulence factor BrkB family protein n=1 Tax=Georgenia wutianyii TaxID=2585135 RepID=A0ABX5VQE2_9MICO|nr:MULTISPECIES: YihY/virulence factor BrkB family protein [Georgenia]QDB80046.1 YihY/virulence factor BrkB family protein [Georgenia wutianyii]TNC17370.1 YihY/virulence factor BrkB family protein [Georgenia sp. 311]
MTSDDHTRPDHPRKPDSPADIRKPSWTYVLRKSVREFLKDDCTTLAAGLTYYAVLSIFPALIALASILSLVGQGSQGTSQVTTLLEDTLPEDTFKQVEPVIENITNVGAPGIGLIIGLLVALWTASNYVTAFAKAMNRIYEVPEGRPIWKLRPLTYLLTLVLLLLVALAVVILVVTGPVAQAVGDVVGLGSTAVTVWNIAKWPVLLVIVVVVIALLYYATPNVKQPKLRWISIGAVIAIVVAALATLALGIYVSQFGSYNETYGALAGVIVFLLWLWIMNLALLFGAEFDAELERARQLQGGIAAEEHIQLPPRDTKASDKKAEQQQEDVERGRALRLSHGRTQDEDAARSSE